MKREMKKNLSKKVLVVLAVMALFSALLYGCGGSGQPDTTAPSAASTEDTADPAETDETGALAETEELANIIMQWPSTGTAGTGLPAVEAALNEITEPEIGVHVTLEPVTLQELLNATTLAVSSGEQLDVCLNVGSPLQAYVSDGLVQPIDEFVALHGDGIEEKLGPKLLGGYMGGQLYAIPVTDVKGLSFGYRMRKDLMEKYNITIDPNKAYTAADFTEIFATVKAGEGDNFFCQIPVFSGVATNPLHGAAFAIDTLGASTASGVMMLDRGFDDLTVVNLYETEEYKAFIELMYDWAQKGYISGDAATNIEDSDVVMSGGNYLGYFAWTVPNGVIEGGRKSGYEYEAITTVPTYMQSSNAAVSWLVPSTSANPEKAVELLNLLLKNVEATTLLMFGIEGQDYEVLQEEGENKMIGYLAEDPSTLPYYMPYGVYGSRLDWPVLDPMPLDMNQILKDLDAAMPDSRISAANGYTFDNSTVATEYAAVSTVIEQYVASMESGAVDPAQALPEFIDGLKNAGIDKVIAENQRQLDEWAAAQ